MLAEQEGTSAPRELESKGQCTRKALLPTSSRVTENSEFKQRLTAVKLPRHPAPSSPGHLIQFPSTASHHFCDLAL